MSNGVSETGLNLIPAGYKQTEVGIIPEDWECSNFDYICSTIGDGIHSTPTYNDNGEYFFINGNNLIDGKITTFNETKKTDFAEFYKHKKNLNERTILLSINGTIGNIAFYRDEQIVLGKSAAYLNIKSTIDKYYIYYCLGSEKTLQAFYDGLTGSTIKNLGLGTIRATNIPLPPKKEQTAIANTLSDVDALVSELEKLIAKKQSIKTSTMQQLLTGRTRLPQFALREDGTKKGTKKSELGEIPEDWKILAMGDLGSTYGGLSGKSKQDFGHGNSLYVPFTNVMANVVVDVDNLEKVDVRETQNNLALGDLLFNGSSETPEEVCFSALVSADIRKLYLNSFCFGFRSNQKNAYLPLYLAYWFRSEVGRAAVLVMAQGSTRYNISKSQFMKLPIVLPDTEEQTAIATILSDMDAEIQALNQRLSKTRQIKQGMMQELLTGKTRLVQPVNKESQHD